MITTIHLRRGTAAQWTTADPILGSGEPGLELDTTKVKWGDGVTHWTALPYSAASAGEFAALAAQKGQPSGLATLDGGGFVPDGQIAATIARDAEVSAAVAAESTARDQAISTAINALVNGAPGLLDTLGEIAAQLGVDESAAAALTIAVNARLTKALYDANSIVKADVDDTPVVLPVPSSTLIGRGASGVITALTVAQVKALLVLSSADLSDVASLATTTALSTAIASEVTARNAAIAAQHTADNGAYAAIGAPSRSPARVPPVQPARSMVSAFQSGHGWTTTNVVAGTTMNDTADIALGTQSAVLVSGTANASSTVVSPTLTNVDMTGKDFRILVKIEGLANVTDFRFYSGDTTLANARNYNLLPVELNGIDASAVKDSEWIWLQIPYTVGSAIGTPVRATNTKMQFRLQAANGTSATLHIGAVAVVPEPSTTGLFPYGAVSFTTDDGRITGLSALRKLLDPLGWAATAYPIVDKVANVTGGTYATLAQLQDARNKMGWEFGCHANLVADHDAGFSTLTAAQVETDLIANRQWLYDNGLGAGEGFAWPKGMSNPTVEYAASKVCAYGRGNYTTALWNRETLPPANPMRLRAFNLGPSTTLGTVTGFIDSAVVVDRGWLILTVHDVVASGAAATTEINQSLLTGIVNYLAGLTNQPSVLPVMDVIRRL